MSSRRRLNIIRWVIAVAAALLFVQGCRSSENNGRTELSVFAASSLMDAFQDLEREFEEVHPEIDVQLTFSGSQILRLQLEQGAAADIFVSANEEHMSALSGAGLISKSQRVAENELVVIVPSDNPSALESFHDLPRASRLVIGTPNVPVGIYTREVLDRAKVQLGEAFSAQVREHVVSEESNVRLVRAKVEMGEADAAIVYRTDAVSSKRVRTLPIPEALNARANYLIGAMSESLNSEAAGLFIAFALSEKGQRVLERHGFITGAE